MSGIDPQTKKFTEPPEQIKREIAALKADKTVPEAEKKACGARGGAQYRKAHSIQGKHRAGAKVLRQALAAYAGAWPRLTQRRGRASRRPRVCTENLIRIDCLAESPKRQRR